MILSRPRIIAQQRFDLEDWNLLLAAARTDSKLQTKQFLSSQNYILKGLSVSGIGFKKATVNMTDATFILPQGTSDFSYFISEPGAPVVEIPDVDLMDNSRNYLEARLVNQDGTPLSRAFWDPEADEGNGAEFNQITNTVTDLLVEFVVRQGGFSSDPDYIKVAIIDTDSSGFISCIYDERDLFYRLATSANIDNSFAWGTKIEPVYTLILSGVSGTFVADEQITIGSETAYVTTGGTTNIAFNVPSGKSFTKGDTVTGVGSGATGTVVSIQESFSGVDKSITDNKKMFDALMTEIKLMKNTRFWWQDAQSSLIGLRKHLESLFTQAVPTAMWEWDGSNLSITDDSGTPADADVLARIRMMGSSQNFNLTREDGSGGSSTIPLASGEVLYVTLPTSGDRTYSGVGSGATNFKIAAIGSYVPSDSNYWIAYCESSRVYIRGYGELETGEAIPIGDPDYETLLANINTRALRSLSNLISTAINQDLVPDFLTNAANRKLGSASLPWSLLRCLNIMSEGVTYTVTGDVSTSNNLITNISGTLPAYSPGFQYVAHSPNFSDGGVNIIQSFDSPTQVTVFDNAGTNGTGITIYIIAMQKTSTDDAVGSVASGAIGRKTGDVVNGRSGPIFESTGNASGTGSSGDKSSYTGDSVGGNSGDHWVGTGLAGGTRGTLFLDALQVNVLNSKIINVLSPTAFQDATNKTYVDAFGGAAVVSTAGGTTTLSDTSARYFLVTGTLTQNYDLPSTALLQVGNTWRFINRSSGVITIRTSASATILSLQPQTIGFFRVLSTGAQTWAAYAQPVYSSVDGSLNFASFKGINAADPTNPQDVATKAYVDAATAGGSSQVNAAFFTSSTSWVCPAGVTRVKVTCVGGGSGAGRNDAGALGGAPGGGGGGTAISWVTVIPGNSYSVVIGGGGAGTSSGTTSGGGNGGNTIFNGGTVVGNGATGATEAPSHQNAQPGLGGGGTGQIVIKGQDGNHIKDVDSGVLTELGGEGGGSHFGGGTGLQISTFSSVGRNASGYGAGGAAGGPGFNGGAGFQGCMLIEWVE